MTDLSLPGCSGLELLRELARLGHELPVLIVTGYGDVPTAVEALREGCVDFIQKPYSEDRLLTAVAGMLACVRPGGAATPHRVAIEERLLRLSSREREVLRHVVAGRPNREIAASLHVSPKTVEAHRARVMVKMKAQSLPQLVRMAVRIGL